MSNMKSIDEFITEGEDVELLNGTYAKLVPDRNSVTKLKEFCKASGIDSIPGDKMHCTIVYSRRPVPEIADFPINLPTSARIKGYKLLDNSNTGGQSLVCLLESNYLQQIFKTFTEDFGATWDYDEFIPHITLNYDWTGPLPEKVPQFSVHFHQFKVEDLDLEWTSDNE